ncbi:MAG TPA: hypothetical protein VMD58_06185 [Acidobacteriaceae bacterium]|nr:hypothetical protein [Acidobacteriaceae bacterium]
MSIAPLVDGSRARSGTTRALRRILSFPVAIAGALSVLAVLTVRDRFDDPDMWWHLRTGQVIWNGHHIPTTDLFSYTTHHHAWVPHEWLSQVLIYGAYRLGGYTGLMVWLCVFASALAIAGYLLCSQYSGNAKVGFLGGALVWFFSTMVLAVRPQVIGYLLLEVELLLLCLGRKRNPRWFYGLPVLFAVWVNCHASFFFGLIVLGVIVGCAFLDYEIGSLAAEQWTAAERKSLVIAACASCAAVFVNPVGWRQVLYPVNTLFHQHIVVTMVDEWKPLPLNDPRGIALLAILAFIGLYVIAQREALIYVHEVVLLAMGTWLGLSHKRLVIVFGILAAMVVTRLLAKSWKGYDAEHDRPAANAVLLALAVVVVLAAFPSRKNLMMQVEQKSPVKAVDYVKAHHLAGNMMNSFTNGGYLIWALPEHPVFVDGRADVYEWTGVLPQVAEWATAESNPNTLLNEYDVSFCLLERGTQIANEMALLPDWKQVYQDDQSVIFVRQGSAAQP